MDLPVTKDRGIKEIEVSVKGGFVSSIIARGESGSETDWGMHFFLGERIR